MSARRAGSRGEWLVVVQLVLIALVFIGPRTSAGVSLWAPSRLGTIAAGVLMAAGGALLAGGLVALGRGLTPLPYPKDDARLIQSGPYAIVRHPMYGGGIILALGWAVYARSWLTLVYVVVLFVFLDAKSRREEAWLTEKFAAYVDYRRRVRKFIPFIY